ncbi:MAG: protein kinase [Gordonia sp. (in: high G+C Gram-positive bacteria)]|uniref:serine/threonine-protein kinase n=1 Tax=Gordonia sp. (in: high G+C Gram-positive bacteria) TaxID=84139 RepID=UPI0039E51D6C
MITVGEEFADYTVLRKVGAGGMGEIFLAQHPRLPRTVALKVLSSKYSTDPEFRQRFLREANLSAGLDHPAVVHVYDRGETDGHLWISMQYIDGSDSLAYIVENGPMRPPVAALVISDIAEGLEFAHAHGVLHRDVKPSNILLRTAGNRVERALIADFGIAHPVAAATKLTAIDSFMGSVDYSAPERILDRHTDGSADQYSLACTTYHLLTGVLPFARDRVTDVITAHIQQPVPLASSANPALGPAVDRVLAKGMAKYPEERYCGCVEFAADLTEALRGPRPRPSTPYPRNSPTQRAPDRRQSPFESETRIMKRQGRTLVDRPLEDPRPGPPSAGPRTTGPRPPGPHSTGPRPHSTGPRPPNALVPPSTGKQGILPPRVSGEVPVDHHYPPIPWALFLSALALCAILAVIITLIIV